ncbi:MAG: bifunctional oligoribonuclease/PAP phosphatase NrnA [Campylobacterales bacterium]|nr:bifunctional oligoribonuclease/PAP phosphatase NrnA [Campylobacterales bacterium]
MKKDFILNNKLNTSAFEDSLKLISESRYILIVTHVSPDADTISSALALSSYFHENKINHKVFNVNLSDVPKRLDFLAHFPKMIQKFPKSYDLIITVDCGSSLRLGFEIPDDMKVINFDHHKSNDNFGTINLLDINKSSTAEIVYDFFKFNGLYITKNTATCLYVGIYEDSLAFTSSRCDESTYEKINFLVKCGADASGIASNLLRRDSLAKYRIMPKILESLELHDEGKVASIYAEEIWFKQSGALLHETEEVLDMIFSISVVKIAVYLRIVNNKVRISLRSKGNIDVALIASKFNGGGHYNASGCIIETKDLQKAKNIIIKEICEK